MTQEADRLLSEARMIDGHPVALSNPSHESYLLVGKGAVGAHRALVGRRSVLVEEDDHVERHLALARRTDPTHVHFVMTDRIAERGPDYIAPVVEVVLEKLREGVGLPEHTVIEVEASAAHIIKVINAAKFAAAHLELGEHVEFAPYQPPAELVNSPHTRSLPLAA